MESPTRKKRNIPGGPICQRRQEDKHDEQGKHIKPKSNDSLSADIGAGGWHSAHARPWDGNWEVDRFSSNKVENRPCDQCGAKVCRQIMVEEQLATHQEKWEVVERPGDKEETSGVPQPVSHDFVVD